LIRLESDGTLLATLGLGTYVGTPYPTRVYRSTDDGASWAAADVPARGLGLTPQIVTSFTTLGASS